MKNLSLIFFLFFPLVCWSQEIQKDTTVIFPEDWIGKWEGVLHIFGPKDTLQNIPMELKISENPENGRWNWFLIYKLEQEDRRAYELVLINEKEGHYRIDEKNSILLDAYLFGNSLISRFSVNASLLTVIYSLDPYTEQVTFEVFGGSKESPFSSGKDLEEFDVFSYPINTRQQAILNRVP